MYDVSSLSPEEKDRLLQMLIEKTGIEPSQNTDHADQAQDQAMLEPIVKAIELMIDKFEMLEERVEALDKLVTDEIIGGITTLYNEKSRMCGISDMQNKYKDMADPYQDFYKEYSNGSLYDDLYDEISKLKQETPEWNDEAESGKVSELLDMVRQKKEKLSGMGGAPDGVAIEVKTETEPSDKQGELVDRIRKMRSASPNVKM